MTDDQEPTRTSWLPDLGNTTTAELRALDPEETREWLDRLKLHVCRPISTIAGSSGS